MKWQCKNCGKTPVNDMIKDGYCIPCHQRLNYMDNPLIDKDHTLVYLCLASKSGNRMLFNIPKQFIVTGKVLRNNTLYRITAEPIIEYDIVKKKYESDK